MIDSIEKFTQLGASVVVVLIFIRYLQTRDGEFTKALNDFNCTIREYLKDSIKVKQELSQRLQQFSDTAQKQSETIRDLKDVTHKMYVELYKKSKIIRKLKQ